jgi:hypothetical protein
MVRPKDSALFVTRPAQVLVALMRFAEFASVSFFDTHAFACHSSENV